MMFSMQMTQMIITWWLQLQNHRLSDNAENTMAPPVINILWLNHDNHDILVS